MAAQTFIYDFNDGTAGEAFVPTHPGTTVYNDVLYSTVSVTGLGISSRVEDSDTSSGTIVQRFTGPGFASLRELWESSPDFMAAYPDYDEFLALVISTYGTEEAGLEALNLSLAPVLPITQYSSRILVTDDPLSLNYAIMVLRTTFEDDVDAAQIQLVFFNEYDSEAGTYRVKARWSEYFEESLDTPIAGYMPEDEWLTLEATQVGDTATFSLKSEGGALIAEKSWTVPGIWVNTETNVWRFAHALYVDDVAWTYVSLDPPTARLRRIVRQYPVHQ